MIYCRMCTRPIFLSKPHSSTLGISILVRIWELVCFYLSALKQKFKPYYTSKYTKIEIESILHNMDFTEAKVDSCWENLFVLGRRKWCPSWHCSSTTAFFHPSFTHFIKRQGREENQSPEKVCFINNSKNHFLQLQRILKGKKNLLSLSSRWQSNKQSLDGAECPPPKKAQRLCGTRRPIWPAKATQSTRVFSRKSFLSQLGWVPLLLTCANTKTTSKISALPF